MDMRIKVEHCNPGGGNVYICCYYCYCWVSVGFVLFDLKGL